MQTVELKPPSPEVAKQAKRALRILAALPRRTYRVMQVRLGDDAKGAVSATVPREAFDLFLEILGQMANGNAVTVLPVHAELTTQQVADLLNVSRPYVIQLLDEGKIPSRKVGAHRRVRAEDVLACKLRDDARRKNVLDELAAEAQKHGLGY